MFKLASELHNVCIHTFRQKSTQEMYYLHQYTEYKTILIQPTHMQAKLPMANLQVQVSSGHGGVAEVSRSHGQSSWVIPTEKNKIKISIWYKI